ncbi:MAG: virulence RhuM family protein [Mucinivorans sp.]
MNEIILYKSIDGNIKVDVLFEEETVWLTQMQLGQLFDRSKATISEHLSSVFKEGELNESSVVRKFRTTAADGKPYDTKYYNLDVIISVGYRVKSVQGTQFRQWATQRLRDYIIKGFALNDERFKSGSSMNYFRELLDRIRDIRLSEKVFYQQVKDIYATSKDYDAADEMTQRFFKEVQNKLLWAISGQTAAELIYYRANASLPQMGLTTTTVPNKVRKADVETAKNYLKEDEIATLKLIVEQFLAFAESQALAGKIMYQKDWIEKLSLVLQMNEKNILTHAGKISHSLAMSKVDQEYGKYKEVQKQIEKSASIKELEEDLKSLKKR